mgnify:CR=1 FL=1
MKRELESMLREVRVEDAIGMILPHDLTQIIPGEFKGRLFKKGHVVQAEDISALLRIGKENIYVLQVDPGWLHEDEAAQRLATAVVGKNLVLTEPHEGKVSLRSTIHGLVKINKTFIDSANEIDQIIFSTIKTNTVVQSQQTVLGTRVIPLLVAAEKIARIEALAEQFSSIIEVKPFRRLKVGVITTGSEVFKGRISDKFGPIVREKVEAFGGEVIEQRLTPDESEQIVAEIRYFQDLHVDLILVTGGMSVDPDDRTPGAIERAGARIVSYGTPMLPGSMLMMAYLDDIPILGLPGCVMHDPYTSFDVLLPRICVGELIERRDITELGYGGLHNC